MHSFANDFKSLEFLLNEYEKTNPKLINMILLKNKDPNGGNNVLELSMKKSNSRCVNLILDKLAHISMNNIHSVKNSFADLLDYNGFESYLKLCFFKTKQMENKQIF